MMPAAATNLGRHLLADLHGIAPDLLTEPQLIEQFLLDAALAAGATPIFSKFHQFGKGQGVTGVLLLRESHISIHTWPEYGFAAVDAFMCGASRPDLAIEILQQAFKPLQSRTEEVLRGELPRTVMSAVAVGQINMRQSLTPGWSRLRER
jgi:S-adenosylmethionine decarboxylase